MTRYEYIKSVGPEKLANYLCDAMEDLSREVDRDSCYVCPLYHRCSYGKKPWLEWLKEEHDRH